MLPRAQFSQAVAEIRFDAAYLLLERPGRLLRELNGCLGPSFGSQVNPAGGILMESTEANLAISVGVNSLIVEQRPADAPTAMNLLAPPAWRAVSEILEVTGNVRRIGLRYWFVYAFDTVNDAWAALNATGLTVPSQSWERLFGRSDRPTISSFMLEGASSRRTALTVVENNVRINAPASWLDRTAIDRYKPPVAIMLDQDYGTSPENGLTERGLGRRMADCWEQARAAAAGFEDLLRSTEEGAELHG